MQAISRDAPCFCLTPAVKDRLPVFRTDGITKITCDRGVASIKEGVWSERRSLSALCGGGAARVRLKKEVLDGSRAMFARKSLALLFPNAFLTLSSIGT